MAVFQLGPIIRNRREELCLSQEDLADGICSVPTLSRIENGERMPTKNHFEMLMQRLGYSAMSLDYFTDKKDFLIHETKIRLRYAYISKDFHAVKELLEQFRSLLDDPTNIDEQFLILYDTLLSPTLHTNEEKLAQLENALRLTCPKYDCNYIPHVLSYEEIILLNNIAICYDAVGNRNKSIAILYSLKDYYDRNMISTDEALRTQPMVLYNLSKYLGLNKQYDECINICELGISIAISTGRCPLLSKTLFNYGWALLQRNASGDAIAAEKALRQAILFAEAMEKHNCLDYERIVNFYQQNFGPNN